MLGGCWRVVEEVKVRKGWVERMERKRVERTVRVIKKRVMGAR